MKFYFFVFSFLFIYFNYSAQNNYNYPQYYSFMWNYYSEEKYDSASLVLKHMDADYKIFPKDLNLCLKIAIKEGDSDLIHKLLIDLVKYSDITYDAFKKKIDNLSDDKLTIHDSVIGTYFQNRAFFLEHLDIDKIIELKELITKDQFLRRNFIDCIESTKVYDESNMKDLLKIIDKQFPNYSQVGEVGFDAIYMIMMHYSSYDTVHFALVDSILLGKVKVGKFENWRYANIVDRFYNINYNYQIYGTLTKRNESGEKIPVQIKDISDVDKRRFDIGLGDFESFAKAFKINKIPNNYRKQVYKFMIK